MRPLRQLVCSFALLALTVPAAADVITVGPTGDFPDLQPAVDAATDGDVLLVDGGTYNGASVVDKGLAVVADLGHVVEVQGGLDVRLLAAGKTVELVGLTVTATAGSLPGLLVLDCAGSVRVEECTLVGALQAFSPGSPGAVVDGCADVAFRGCAITAGAQLGSLGAPPPGAAGLVAVASTLAVNGGSITGGQGTGTLSGGDGGEGGPGLDVSGAVVFASGVDVTGGQGGGGTGCTEITPSYAGGPGGPAVRLDGGPPATRFRYRDVTLTGGAGGTGGQPGVLCSDTGPDGPDGAALVDPGGAAVPVAGVARTLEASAPWREQTLFPLDVHAEPGDLAAVLGSVAPATSWQLGAGQLLLAAPFQLRILGVVPGGGTLSLSVAFPDLGPGVESVTLYTQALYLDTLGTLSLGEPFTVVVLDGAF